MAEYRHAPATCPVCRTAMELRLLSESTVALAREAFAGVELLRCAECAGCFVPRAAFNALLDLDPHARVREDAPAEKKSALHRFLLAVAKIFGAEPTTQVRIDE